METEKSAYITQIEVTDFLEKGQNLCLPLNEDVTVLAGDNGTGKTVLLSIIEKVLMDNNMGRLKELFTSVVFHTSDIESPLVAVVDNYGCITINGRHSTGNMWYINPRIIHSTWSIISGRHFVEPKEKIVLFLDVVNSILCRFNIEARIVGLSLCFFRDNKEIYLSEGQSRLVLILLRAWSFPNLSYPLLLIDTPETFLHTNVQRILIESIRKINPNIQLLITTHSPGILMNGGLNWIVNMKQILSKVE